MSNPSDTNPSESNASGARDESREAEQNDEKGRVEPSLQDHHNAETEADSASGGSSEGPEGDETDVKP
jgi:hypothetical protein